MTTPLNEQIGDNRDEYFDQLEALFNKWYSAGTMSEEYLIEKEILSITFDPVVEAKKRIEELEKVLMELTTVIDRADTFEWRGTYIGQILESSNEAKELLNPKQ